MEKQIKYVQLSADNAENCKVYESLMYEYIDEMNEHSEPSTTERVSAEMDQQHHCHARTDRSPFGIVLCRGNADWLPLRKNRP